MADRRLGLEREHDGPHDVRDVGEVARLLAVLEDDRRAGVEQTRGEDRGHAGVRVGERLARPVDVEEAQGDRGDPVRRAGHEDHLLVVALVDRVDRGGDQRLGLARAQRLELAPAGGACGLPGAREELLLGPRAGGDAPVLLALVLALAVDRHRRGDDHADGHRALGHDVLEEARGGHRVELGVARDLVHRLADADRSGEVDDLRGARQGARGGLAIADVAHDQLDARGKLGLGAAVDLLLEAVEHDHVVAALDERADEVRADEAGPAGDKCPHEMLILRRLNSISFGPTPVGAGFFRRGDRRRVDAACRGVRRRGRSGGPPALGWER